MVVRTEPQMELFWTSVVNGTLWSKQVLLHVVRVGEPDRELLVAGGVSVPSTTRFLRLDDQRRTVWTCFASTAF